MKTRLLFVFLAGFVLCLTAFSAKLEKQQSDEEIFNIVSSKLDKGGSYYSIQNTKYLFSYIQGGLKAARNLLGAIPAQQLGGVPPMMIMDAVEAIINDSGVNEVLACGMSSILINPKAKEPLFQNKTFLYHGSKKPKGFLWTLIPPDNKKLTDIYRLPKNTLSAFSADIYPAKMWDTIKKVLTKLPVPPLKMMPALAEMQFMQRYKLQLPVVLESLSGSWFGVVVSTKAADGKPALQGMLEVPAKSAVFFDLLKTNFKNNPLAIITDGKITIKATGKDQPEWIAPSIFARDKKLYFISSPKILASTKEAMTKRNGLVTTAEFKRFNQRMPEQGVSFVYRSPRIPVVVSDMIKAYAPKNVAEKSAMFNSVSALITNDILFTIVTRTKDGVLVYSNSPTTTVSNTSSLTYVATTGILAGMLLPALNQAREKARRISCVSNLKQIGLALKQYGMDHKDNFPKADNVAGLNELVKNDYLIDPKVYNCPSVSNPQARGILKEANSSYIYLGGFREEFNSALPLAFDKPGNHKGYINILFLDGHVKGLILNYRNCEQVIRFLNRSNGYKPEKFNMLLKKAQKIDRELNYK